MELNREYKRDMYNNYMVIPALEDDRFEARMLMENQIDGIMKVQIRNIDDVEYYYYDITSKQPIANLFERGQLGYDQIKSIVGGIIYAIEKGSEYLLNENDFILDVEYIFITLSSFTVSLCYFPGYECDVAKQFTGVIEYLMDKADHTDEKAVMLVYSLYKAAKQECTLTELKERLEGVGFANDVNVNEFSRVDMISSNDIHQNVEQNKKQSSQQNIDSKAQYQRNNFDDTDKNYDLHDDSNSSDTHNNNYELFDGVKTLVPFIAGIEVVVLCLAYFSGFIIDKNGNIDWIRTVSVVIISITIIMYFAVKLQDELNIFKKEDNKAEGIKDNGKESREGNTDDRRECERNIESLNYEDDFIFSSDSTQDNSDYAGYENETVLLADYRRKEDVFELISLHSDKYESAQIVHTPFVVGKLMDKVDFVLGDDAISRLHAKIDKIDNGEMTITDLNSKNGTYINGERLLANETRKIFRGDEIGFADLIFTLR